MTKKQERHIIAAVGTILFMVLVFLLLWLLRLWAVQPEQDEGIEVAFGEVQEAGGYMVEQSEAVPMPSPEEATPIQPSQPAEEEHITTEDPEALALAEAKKKREAEEKARLEAERKAREAAEAERKAKEAEAIAKANQLGSLFGQSGNTTGSGNSQGSGQKGNPVGHGSSGGNNWSLNGRSLKGTLPQPSNDFKQEGKVVVQIRVNPAGQVINATITGGDVSDKQTQQLALDAAKKAKFTEGEHDQIGTITYIFKLN
ncbi:MAG: TonB family protein [Paludibacteraceae bacterium]|nr:TonB family protein [Paludibacteraceae bacterium]